MGNLRDVAEEEEEVIPVRVEEGASAMGNLKEVAEEEEISAKAAEGASAIGNVEVSEKEDEEISVKSEKGASAMGNVKEVTHGEEEEDSILIPRNDRRLYRKIVLDNAMKVLLVSDAETDKAAAGMDVHIGSFSDPEDLPGLAHFLEHMLFYSSEKYPQEDAFFKFLGEHGGTSNAYTVPEHTNFHFEVSADQLENALDRFAQFFISPLFSADAVSREIRAVDSEHSKNLTADVRRRKQLGKHISSKDHPYHKFGSGNLNTLEIEPKKKGVDTRKELIKFYEARYSSNLMSLVVYGREGLDELQKLTEEKFSAVRNTGKEVPRFQGQPCSEEHSQVLVKAVPVLEGHLLRLVWPITPGIQNYRAAPSMYISHLLGHEGDGSLFSLLKHLGWANSSWASEDEGDLDFAFFVLSVELTDLGQEHMREVVGFAFQYLNILKTQGVVSWCFEEIQAVCDMKFHFQDKWPPITYVTRLANNMQLYPVHDWLAGPYLARKFDSDVLSRAIHQLSPETVRIFWYSKQFQGVATEVEPWYGTSYTVEKIEKSLIKDWEGGVVDSRLHLPSPNVFIPTDFRLIKVCEPRVHQPSVIAKTQMSRLWYKPDTKFSTPKACIRMHFHCAESHYSPEAVILTVIFTKLLVDYLNDHAYYAQIAGLTYNIHATCCGFQVSVSGYNHKLIALTEKIVDKLVNFQVDNHRFDVIKQKVLKDCVNFRFQQPNAQARYNCSLILENNRRHLDEFIEVLPSLSPDDLRLMFPRILSRVFLQCYVAGNIGPGDAEKLVSHVEAVLRQGPTVKSKPPFSSQVLEKRILKLEDGADFSYLTAALNPKDTNSALQVYFQVGQEESRLNVLVDLLVLTAKEGVFYQLRTVEQLGYIVYLAPRNDSGVRGIQFVIQSTAKDPGALDERVEAFIERHADCLEKMSEEEFNTHAETLVKTKLEKHKNLWEEANFFWTEITDGTLKFDRSELEVAALKQLNKQDLLKFFKDHFQRNAPKRRKLSLQVFGSLHTDEYKASKAGTELSEVEDDSLQVSEVNVRKNGVVVHAMVGGKQSGMLKESIQVEEVEVRKDGLIVHARVGGKQSDELNGSHLRIKPQRQARIIDDIYAFKRAQGLFESLTGGLHPVYR